MVKMVKLVRKTQIVPLARAINLPLAKMKILQQINYRLEQLQSVAGEAICAVLSFVCAGYLQHQIERSNSHRISILWQFPQFFLLMLGETLLSIPGLQFSFSYTQAPSWFINCAIGNLIVVVVTELNLFQRQSNEFFFYATFMFVCTIVLSFASFYDHENRNVQVHNFNTKSQNVQSSRTTVDDV